MNSYNVPQDINRNVISAVYQLQSERSCSFVQRDTIAAQVKRQMRRHRPTHQMDKYIKDSLKNLTGIGVLAKTGSNEYAMRNLLCFSAPTPGLPLMPIPNVVEKPPGKWRWDPRNRARDLISTESISGSFLDKGRKRLRSNNKRLPVPKRPRQPQKPVKLDKGSIKVTTRQSRKQHNLVSESNAALAAFTRAHKRLLEEDEMSKSQNSPVFEGLTTEPELYPNEPHPTNGDQHIAVTSENVGQQNEIPSNLSGDRLPSQQQINLGYALSLFSPSTTDFDMALQPNRDDASVLALCGSHTQFTTGFQKLWMPYWERQSGAQSNVTQVESQYKWIPMPKDGNP